MTVWKSFFRRRTKAFHACVLEFKPAHKKQDAFGVAGTHEELDHGRQSEFAGASRHFKKEPGLSLADRFLKRDATRI